MPGKRQRVWLALAVSFAVHAGFVLSPDFAPGWVDSSGEATRIDVSMATAPIPARTPKRDATPAMPPVALLDAPPDVVEPVHEPSPVKAQPEKRAQAPEKTATQADAPTSFPRRARLGFALTRGENGLLLGRTVQTWQVEGDRYRISSVSQSAGLVALFKTVKLAQYSEGEWNENGLRPQRFRTERDGVVTEEAQFDWPQHQVTLKSGDNSQAAALVDGAQDVLSLFYQAAMIWRGQPELSVHVATGKKFNLYTLRVVGEENLATRLGVLRTIHLRRDSAPGEDGTDIWLAPDALNLPVRIRFTDRKGDIFEQLIEDIEIDGARWRQTVNENNEGENAPPIAQAQ